VAESSINDNDRLSSGRKEELPDGRKIYGCQDTQDPAVARTFVATTIAESYTPFANEAHWAAKCSRSFTMAVTGDD
jgi:hypothetical protein